MSSNKLSCPVPALVAVEEARSFPLENKEKLEPDLGPKVGFIVICF